MLVSGGRLRNLSENKNEKKRKRGREEGARKKKKKRYVGGKSVRRRRNVKESIGEEKRGHGAVGQ